MFANVAVKDIVQITWALAWNDIKTKYRRTIMGPVWLVLGMAITLGIMSVVWSQIFGVKWQEYLPYIIIGMVSWIWISTYVVEAPEIYCMQYASILSAMRTSAPLLAARSVLRGFILYLHYSPVYLAVILIAGTVPSVYSIFLIPLGLAIVLVNAFSFTITFGFLGARMRDISPFVGAVMAPMMLLSPVLWKPEDLGEMRIIADVNPFTHFIELVRAPLLGEPISTLSWSYVAIFTILNIVLSIWVFRTYRTKLAFWL